MPSGSRAVLLLSLILLSSAAAAPTLAALGSSGETGVQPQTSGTDGSEVSETIVIDLQENGDAELTVTKTYSLSSRNETAAFDDLATDFENGETDDLGLAAFQKASQLASDSTGREMSITNVSRDSGRTGTATNGTGELTISFTWTSFGRVEDGRFYIDDVFTTSQGPWLQRLDENQRLVVRPPDGYEFFDAPVPVTLRNGTIQWTGPQEFDANSLSATFERTSSQPTTPNGTATPTPGGSSDNSSFLWAGLLVLGLGTVAVVGYLLSKGEVLELPADEGDDPPIVPTQEESSTGTDEEPPPEDGPEGDEDEEEAIDVELLSDEERVERLLEENGGRMKQANIVKETGWSNAKVSQLLSAMEDEDRIDKLRIGRENLISFPDEDVTEFDE